MGHLILTGRQLPQKRYITLIEIMIVMFLIALIAGVVAYNYRGSLDEGRAFQTKQNIEKVRNILELEMARTPTADLTSQGGWQALVRRSPLIKDADSTMRDGWGNELVVVYADGAFKISSTAPFCAANPDKCPPSQ